MVEWILVCGSGRIVADAYDANKGVIYVRFSDGVEWWYGDCGLESWKEFCQSRELRGEYIDRVLRFRRNGRFGGQSA